MKESETERSDGSGTFSDILGVFGRAIDFKQFNGCIGPVGAIRQYNLVQFKVVHYITIR